MGPTAAGKTSAALALAKDIAGEVINVDSRQVYADFPLITAQPSETEHRVCPHLLYGFLSANECLGAVQYAGLLQKTIDEVLARHHTPILTGGTGLYFQTLEKPLAPIPDIDSGIRQTVRRRCQNLGSVVLHKELATQDPELAKRLHPNDSQRIMRGLEVFYSTGKPLSLWHEKKTKPRDMDFLKIGVGLPLAELTPRFALRINQMLKAGAIQEATKAMKKNNNPKAPGWTSIGCAELLAFLQENITLNTAVDLWAKNTRAYAKRQITWFKADKKIHWFSPDEHAAILHLTQQFLS